MELQELHCGTQMTQELLSAEIMECALVKS